MQMKLYMYEMENRLREREQWFETILMSISDGVIVTDKKGSIIFLNRRAEQITGYNKTQAFGKNIFDVYKILDDKEIGLEFIPIKLEVKAKF